MLFAELPDIAPQDGAFDFLFLPISISLGHIMTVTVKKLKWTHIETTTKKILWSDHLPGCLQIVVINELPTEIHQLEYGIQLIMLSAYMVNF